MLSAVNIDVQAVLGVIIPVLATLTTVLIGWITTRGQRAIAKDTVILTRENAADELIQAANTAMSKENERLYKVQDRLYAEIDRVTAERDAALRERDTLRQELEACRGR